MHCQRLLTDVSNCMNAKRKSVSADRDLASNFTKEAMVMTFKFSTATRTKSNRLQTSASMGNIEVTNIFGDENGGSF